MNIAPNIELPDAALIHHVAIVGATGSGKTYTAKGVVEKLLDMRRRVVILDPTGAWWGLRLKSDGVTPAFYQAIKDKYDQPGPDVEIPQLAGIRLVPDLPPESPREWIFLPRKAVRA